MRYRIDHVTRFDLASPVWEHQCELRLTPRDDEHQRVENVELSVDPPAKLGTYVDSFGNRVHTLSLIDPHQHLEARMLATVETVLANPFDFTPLRPQDEGAWMKQALRDQPRLWDYVFAGETARSTATEVDAAELSLPTHSSDRTLLASVQTAMGWIGENFEYRSGVTHVHSPLSDVLRARAGVCQDFAHLLILIVRSWGFPARYVMGYLDPAGDPAGSPHAWAEVLIPGAGWRGFDATHNLVVNDAYVALNVGRDYADAAPLRGSFKGEAPTTPPEVALAIDRDQQ